MARAIQRRTGWPLSRCIATAINALKYSAATGDSTLLGKQNEGADVVQAHAAAIAHWESMKGHRTAHKGGDGLALAGGGWNALLHPRIPAGQAGGGKFAKGTGAKKAGAKGGKGGAKGKGAKGAKASAAAQAAAQAKIIAPQFLKMNPTQRAAFLAKLTNPQLAALYKVINAGNTNDPSTRAALIAIKDQMAARSLTGAKGPTAINQAKAASAAKSAASKQAAAAKKASTAQATAAKKASAAQAAAARRQLASAKAAAAVQAKAAKTAAANQSATMKAQAAMQATTQKAKVSGLTAALKSTSNPQQQAQILAQLKTALGLAQTARVVDVLALAGEHHFRHGWIPLDGKEAGKGAPKLPAPVAHASILGVTKNVGDRRAHAAKLSDSMLAATDKELGRRATSYQRSGQVVAHHRVVKEEIAKRSAAADPKNRSTDPATIKAAIKALDVQMKHGTVSTATGRGQKAQLMAKLAKAQELAKRKPTRLAHDDTDGALTLSMPMNSSQDGPQVTMNAALATPHDIRRAVKAHDMVHPTMRPAYRKTVVKAAKRMGAMGHVPDAWMTPAS